MPLLFGNSTSAITIGICTLIINILLLPIVFSSLNLEHSFKKRVLDTFKKPLVLSALLGFILALLGWKMPTELINSFELLGKSAGGLAIFAIGIVLCTRKILIKRIVFLTVLEKNLLFPLIIWLIMLALHLPTELQKLVVLTLAIPTATMPTTLSIQYNVAESELASIQFWSTIFSFVTLSLFLLLLS